MKKYNLNEERIPGDDYKLPGTPLANNNTTTEQSFDKVEAIFRNHERKLLALIKRFEKGAIFGCVAWLTSEPVLQALAKCQNVQIIVQKEDFLRPDSNRVKPNFWKIKLQGLYKKIKFEIPRFDMQHGAEDLSVCGNCSVEGIRCVGNHNKDKNPAFPRAHHKFLIFCDTEDSLRHFEDGSTQDRTHYKPVAVWTGSYNITDNATRSFENVIYLEDKSGENPVIEAYLKEHHQIFAISEPLNWSSDWCAPEYRIGT